MRRPRFGAVLAVVVVLLAGCTGKATVPDAAAALRIGVRQPSTLDPVMRANPSDLLIARQIYEPLVGFDPQSGSLVARLASSWEALDGGRTFRFHLRSQARFQNGAAVTAGDVAFELNRLARKATNSSLAHLLSPVVGFDAVHNTGAADTLSGVKVDDDHTLTISLGDAWYEFPYVLTDPATAPIPAGAFQADPTGFMRHPVGSGPYALAPGSGLPGDLVLRRSKDYWGAPPPIASVRFATRASPAQVLGDLSTGSLDVGEVPSDGMSPALAAFGSRGYTPLAAEIDLGFNLADPALADARLRQAISLAIDRQAIAATAYGDVVVPANGLMPRGLAGHTDLACRAACGHDLAKARSLVQEVSGTAQPEIAFDFPQGGANDAVAAELISELAAVGIKVQGRSRSPADFLSTLNAAGQEMFLWIWVADYPLADWFLSPLFSPNSPDNHTGYKDSGVQDLLTKAHSTADPAARIGLEQQAEQKVLGDLPMTPVAFFRNHYAARREVQGFYVDVLGGFDVARLSLPAA